MKIVYNDYDSDYADLIERFGTHTMLQSRLRFIIIEVFKSLKNINPVYLKELFHHQIQPYSLRDPYPLIQEKRNTTTFGLRSFVYLGSKLWNNLPGHLKDIEDMYICGFKMRLKDCPDLKLNSWKPPIV